jgi:molecular chaperone HtpG
MSAPKDLDVADALAELVDQFADPLVFLRELVQNSLDAGSPEVDVYTEFRPSPEDPERGVMVIGVDDYGEGMDRHTIDTKLTRLFSSSKDGDLTKIGKFGIGFVSVFSLRPDAVCVDTSRGGEHWRILFRADRSFVRIAREQPVDGTKIQVIKAATRAEHAAIAERAEATLRAWCKHVAGTVRWHDEDIAEPFDLPGALCTVRHESPSLRAVVGYLPGGAETHGFYNRGLTLLEGREADFVDGVAFKIDSKHLEHTLARNDVMRDANFDQVMAVVRRMVAEELDAALVQAVTRRVRAGEDHASLDAAYGVLATVVRGRGVPPDAPIVRTVEGAEVGAAALRKAAKADTLWVATLGSPPVRSPVVAAAIAAGHTVISTGKGSAGLRGLLRAVVGRELQEADRGLVRPEPASLPGEAARWAPLATALQALLSALDRDVEGVALAHLGYPGSIVADRVYVLGPAGAALWPWNAETVRPFDRWRRKDTVIVNADHSGVAPLVLLARQEPELSAYTLLKLVCLDAGPLPVELDARLCTASAELRARRLGGGA